ncbi:MAG: glycosyltransferase family 4 protein [Chitinophagales bacterium]
MRIAINTRFLLPNKLEGFGWYTHELVNRMARLHPEHSFLFLFDRPYDDRFVYAPNITPVVVHPPARHPILFYIWFEWAIPRVLKKWKADVFFSPDSLLSLRSTVPTVLTVHDVIPLQMPDQLKWEHRVYYQHFLPKFIHRAERVLTVSNYTKESIVETTGARPEKIQVVYNGCRDLFRPLNERERQQVRLKYTGGKPYFFYTGAIHPRKNIPFLIRAFNRFKEETGADVLLVLAGRYAWKTGPVQEALEQSRWRSDIILLGYVEDSDLAALMASALALVYPSISEGFGLPILEAMYCDVPVITSNTTAMPEVAGDAALMMDPYQLESLLGCMIELWSQPDKSALLVERGRIQRQQFSWDLAAEQTLAVILETGKK